MAEGAKYIVIRKLLKALGLPEEAIEDVIEWIEENPENPGHFPYLPMGVNNGHVTCKR